MLHDLRRSFSADFVISIFNELYYSFLGCVYISYPLTPNVPITSELHEQTLVVYLGHRWVPRKPLSFVTCGLLDMRSVSYLFPPDKTR
ncbi:hypothetical protein AVEN_130341-1 [Araneus ventricosus]|uniref:Uncharacterized protein n=1 Tax=Araneus ventricosus TaxID=182803 RepID=A0A4Y2BG04_ARAVE|nr:hypothetical protein AVEN_130341-1 [Araneus ventricosus]